MKTDKKISRLNPLIGTWTIEGANFPSAPQTADTPLTGLWKVKVMAGGKFLESHWEYGFGNDKPIGLSVLDFQDNDTQLKIFSFDNGGFHRAYDVNIEGNLWKIEEETERASMVFEDNGDTYKEFWEIKWDGEWKPLCRRTGKRRLETN